jgi:DNA mismatch endonuclease (patch repair protein)
MYTVPAYLMDIVDSHVRSSMMSGIRDRDTRPELLLRSGLQRLGYRHRLGTSYRWQGKLLPSRPDLVFPKYRTVIQVNGCFWHCHQCHLFRWPKTRQEFWKKKLWDNAKRDIRNSAGLKDLGWRVLTMWECAIKGNAKRPFAEVIQTAANWIQFSEGSAALDGYHSD